jgi:hypothetical protein
MYTVQFNKKSHQLKYGRHKQQGYKQQQEYQQQQERQQ